MEMLNSIVLSLNNVLTSSVLLIALVGAGIWFSIQLGFVQVKGFGEGMKRTFGGMFKKDGKKAGDDGMSSFQALATAIAAQVGTGNIAGAATAIAVGGPGAIFWMWVSAFLGMATIFGEACMAQKYKQVAKDGSVTGGPVYYIKAAFSGGFGKVLAAVFAVLVILALGFMGNIVQSNSIAASWNNAFGVPKIAMGIVLAVISFLVFSGGMGRIAKVTETIVPVMAAFYILGALIVIIANGNMIPSAFHDIIVGAFDPTAVAGGAMGATIKLAVTKGVARGLFSNEAGMGSTPHAHAVAKVDHPVEQGLTAMVGVLSIHLLFLTLQLLLSSQQALEVQVYQVLNYHRLLSLMYLDRLVQSSLRFVCSSLHSQQLSDGTSLVKQTLDICLVQKPLRFTQHSFLSVYVLDLLGKLNLYGIWLTASTV